MCAGFTYSHTADSLGTVSIAQNAFSVFWRDTAIPFWKGLRTVGSVPLCVCLLPHQWWELEESYQCLYTIDSILTSSKAGNSVLKIRQNWSFLGKLEIIKLIPEVSCISNKARLMYAFREDPSWKAHLSLHVISCLLIIFWQSCIVGVPIWFLLYPTLLCGTYLQGVHTNAGQLCCLTCSIRWFLALVA